MEPAKAANKRSVGNAGENLAVEYLQRAGYEVLDRNFYTRYGELDLVARTPEDDLAFVEVKYRTADTDGGGVAAVGPRKLRRIRTLAGLWLEQNREGARFSGGLRVDVIDVGPCGVREHVEGVW